MALGPVMIDLDGPELSAAERELLADPNVGGVILFRRNYVDPQQLQALIGAIRDAAAPGVLIAVDQEGGRVQRLRAGFTPLPPAARLGALYDRDPARARGYAEQVGWLLAAELRAVGIDFSFAPVLDLGQGISDVIGDRALHAEPAAVATLATSLVRGMARAGMAAVGKHFPGHGSVAADSHHECPVDERPLEQILERDARPFAALVASGLPGIMPAHVRYAAVDDVPAGHSAVWLEQILRQRFGFTGALFSDDLSMAAVAGQPPGARGEAALAAGCDMVLVCNDRPAAEAVIEHLGRAERPLSQVRLARMHGRGGAPGRERLHRQKAWAEACRIAEDLVAA